MRIDKSSNSYVVEFEREDWTNNFARNSIQIFKNGKGKYDPRLRNWRISFEVYEIWKNEYEAELNLFYNNQRFKEVEKDKDEIAIAIGTTIEDNISLIGLIELKERIDKFKKFIDFLNKLGGKERIIKLYEDNLSQMEETFNQILNKPL